MRSTSDLVQALGSEAERPMGGSTMPPYFSHPHVLKTIHAEKPSAEEYLPFINE
jgi:hypothetical protein